MPVVRANNAEGDGGAKDGPGLAALATAAVALVTGVGALTLTGALGRVQRNHGEAFALALGLVVFGAGLWIAAALIPATSGWKLRRRNVALRPLVQGIGVLFSLAGVVLGFYKAVTTASETEQPAVTLKLNSQTLAAEVSAQVGNLSSTDQLVVYVDALVDKTGGGYDETNLYRAFIGPDGDGHASNSIEVKVPPGRYDAVGVRAFTTEGAKGCGYPLKGRRPGEDTTGCLIDRLPRPPLRPQITSSWEGEGSAAASLKIGMEISNSAAGNSKDAVAMLRVLGVRKRRTLTLYRTTVEPQIGGPTRRELRLPIEANIRKVCVEARMMAPGAEVPEAVCPTVRDERVALVELRVPQTSSARPAPDPTTAPAKVDP